ncbi:MAG: hypothetical protein IPJ69_05750 [Deltaproteobacteria bacterium]|nr:MAG: hypothetical protein IPJ69_05750 [Deltaproteobacteria bacterium]
MRTNVPICRPTDYATQHALNLLDPERLHLAGLTPAEFDHLKVPAGDTFHHHPESEGLLNALCRERLLSSPPVIVDPLSSTDEPHHLAGIFYDLLMDERQRLAMQVRPGPGLMRETDFLFRAQAHAIIGFSFYLLGNHHQAQISYEDAKLEAEELEPSLRERVQLLLRFCAQGQWNEMANYCVTNDYGGFNQRIINESQQAAMDRRWDHAIEKALSINRRWMGDRARAILYLIQLAEKNGLIDRLSVMAGASYWPTRKCSVPAIEIRHGKNTVTINGLSFYVEPHIPGLDREAGFTGLHLIPQGGAFSIAEWAQQDLTTFTHFLFRHGFLSFEQTKPEREAFNVLPGNYIESAALFHRDYSQKAKIASLILQAVEGVGRQARTLVAPAFFIHHFIASNPGVVDPETDIFIKLPPAMKVRLGEFRDQLKLGRVDSSTPILDQLTFTSGIRGYDLTGFQVVNAEITEALRRAGRLYEHCYTDGSALAIDNHDGHRHGGCSKVMHRREDPPGCSYEKGSIRKAYIHDLPDKTYCLSRDSSRPASQLTG